jgi:hypothetical protein
MELPLTFRWLKAGLKASKVGTGVEIHSTWLAADGPALTGRDKEAGSAAGSCTVPLPLGFMKDMKPSLESSVLTTTLQVLVLDALGCLVESTAQKGPATPPAAAEEEEEEEKEAAAAAAAAAAVAARAACRVRAMASVQSSGEKSMKGQ